MRDRTAQFAELKGKTFASVAGCEKDSDCIIFTCTDGTTYELYHEQECCEDVHVNDVVGNVEDLIGTEILVADEVSSDEFVSTQPVYDFHSETWTFYKLATVKGYVDIRWYGTSNGYYSESVAFARTS